MFKITSLYSTLLSISLLSASLTEENEIKQSILNNAPPSLKVNVSAPTIFFYNRPYFELKVVGYNQPQQVWWQISEDPDFKEICSCLEGIDPFTDCIELSEFADEHLKPDVVYYFRTCVDFGDWSPVCFFQTEKATYKQPKEYVYNPYVPLDVWEQVKPFFLPIDHPVKKKLDKIFKTSKRVTLSKKTLEAAGFKNIKERSPHNIILGRHPDLKGYLLKIYLDTQAPINEWQNFRCRILGAETIRGFLETHNLNHFKVPKKWIYPLPAEPSPSPEYHRKNFILVVEDMNILKSSLNRKAFEDRMTPSILNSLYFIIDQLGLIDSLYPFNIPFTKSGKIAFVDTEHYNKRPVPFEKLLPFLSIPMRNHWQKLIEQGGPIVKSRQE